MSDNSNIPDPAPADDLPVPNIPVASDVSSANTSSDAGGTNMGGEDSSGSGKFGTKKIASVLVAVTVLVASFGIVRSVFGSSSGSNGSILVAYDPEGSGTYYTAEIKDGKAVIGSRITSEDVGSIDVRADRSDSDFSNQELVAIDKKTVLMKQYPEGSDEDSTDVIKMNLDTMETTTLFSSDDGISAIYLVKEELLLVTDDDACFKVDLDGISTRIGNGSCNVAGGRVSAVERNDDEIVFIYLDNDDKVGNPISIKLPSVDGYSADRSIVWGRNSDGDLLVYNAITGNQVWKYGDDKSSATILSASNDGSTLLASLDEFENTDGKLDLVVVRDLDGSPLPTVLTSAFRVGGVIAPDGSGVIAFSQDIDSETGKVEFFDKTFKNPKSVAPRALVKNMAVTSTGLAVVIAEDGVYSGAFSEGFERKADGEFSTGAGIYAIKDSQALLMNLEGSSGDDGGKSQILYLPAPLSNDGSSNSVTVATGSDDAYYFNETSLARDGRLVFATESDDYVTINERGLKKDADVARLVEGRLNSYFEVSGDRLRYYEKLSGDRYTTYELKGTKAADRVVVADGYYLLEIPIGDPENKNKLERVQWSYSTEVAQIDDDLKKCNESGYTVLKQGSSETVTIAANTLSEYSWTYFCVQNAAKGALTSVSTSNSVSNTAGKDLWTRLVCSDDDDYGSDAIDSREIATQGGYGPYGTYTSPLSGSYHTCRIADNAYHGGYYSSSYSIGGSITVSVGTQSEDPGE